MPSPTIVERCARTSQLVRMLAPREFRIRYRQSVLDVAWALISPVVIAMTYGYILTRSFNVTGGCAPYASSAWTGLVLWTFFATSVSSASTSLVSSADLVKKVYFPRESLPLAMTAATLVDLGVGTVTVIMLMLYQGVGLSPSSLQAILPLANLVVWTAALGLLVGVAAAFARDTLHAVNLALRVGFFATPVVYSASQLPAAAAWSARVNPIAVSITGVRESLLCGQSTDLPLLTIHIFSGLALLVSLIFYTRSIESRIADVI